MKISLSSLLYWIHQLISPTEHQVGIYNCDLEKNNVYHFSMCDGVKLNSSAEDSGGPAQVCVHTIYFY